MSQLPVSQVGLDWIAALAVLWVGGAAWTTAAAAHLRLPEWKWFGLALLTGPLAWTLVYIRLRSVRRRGLPVDEPAPEPASSTGPTSPRA